MISGAGRLAAGGMQLVLLALGVLVGLAAGDRLTVLFTTDRALGRQARETAQRE